MAVYGPSYAEELYHWKYKYKKRINGKWRYYYDETNLNKNNYKTLDDAMKLHKTQKKNYAFKSIAENWNAKHAGTMLTDDERETAKAMSEYYAEKK